MADIRTTYYDMQTGSDYAISAMLLQNDDGLDTAVVLSLFTDRRAKDDDKLPGNTEDKRGAWVDSFAEVKGDQFGSRLWLLENAKLLPETVNRVREYCAEALDWLVKDGIAKAVNVTAEIVRNYPLGIINAQIDIVKPDGTISRYKFNNLWGNA